MGVVIVSHIETCPVIYIRLLIVREGFLLAGGNAPEITSTSPSMTCFQMNRRFMLLKQPYLSTNVLGCLHISRELAEFDSAYVKKLRNFPLASSQ